MRKGDGARGRREEEGGAGWSLLAMPRLATGRSCWPEWLLAGVVGAAGWRCRLAAPRENCWRKEEKIKRRGRRGEEKRAGKEKERSGEEKAGR